MCANRDVRLNSRDNFDDFELWCPRQQPLANYLKISPPVENVFHFSSPPVEWLVQIFRHKIVETTTADVRLVSFHAVLKDQRQVITATYFKRRKRLELRFGKKMEHLSK